MKGVKLIMGAGVVAVLGGTGLLMTAFLGKAAGYETGTAGYGNISQSVEATGDVHGERSMTYYSQVTAPVSYYDLSSGDEVKSGDKVVGYDLDDLMKIYEQAELTAKSAENTMNGQVKASDSNQAKYNKAASDIEVYRNAYALFRMANDYVNQGQYQESWDVGCIADGINKDIAEKSGQVNALQAELTKQQIRLSEPDVIADAEEFKRTEKEVNRLADEIAGLSRDIGNLQSDLAGLPPTNLSPEEYAMTVINGNWMSDIMRNWTEASTLKNTYENQILNSYQKEQLKNSYDLSALSVETASENLTKATAGVSIEFDGVITESMIESGTVVTKGTPLFTVESSKDMKVDVGISKYDIGKIAVGQKAEITIAGNIYPGTVSQIKRIAEKGSSDKAKVTVSVKFDEPDERVYIGLEADVKIFTDERQGALTIPAEAYYADDGGDYCYIIKDGVIAKQYITTGVESDDLIEVTMGLKEGDVVITDAITDEKIGTAAESK
ncbi:MAG: efflux RND transporter periplasmic adaptor subunit [Lachnospiraceae bacterium]|nr:efflux RND transporter periplasmic adaptor subunit [Lachnospiraceae bacterium]